MIRYMNNLCGKRIELTNEEVCNLISIHRECDDPNKKREIENKILSAYIPLVTSIVRRYGMGDPDDCVSTALDRVCASIPYFDINRGVKFGSYVCTAMIRSMRFRKRRIRLTRQYYCCPYYVAGELWGNEVYSDFNEPDEYLNKVNRTLNEISARDRKILIRYIVDGETLEAVGRSFDLTKQRIKQVIDNSLAIMRWRIMR